MTSTPCSSTRRSSSFCRSTAFFFQAEDGIRDFCLSRGLGDVYKRQSIGISFIIAGVFYAAFGSATSFVLALIVLGIAHCGGSILWVFSTVILQRAVEDKFRGRVFAAELAFMTLTMAASNYTTGELLDRFKISPRLVTVGI